MVSDFENLLSLFNWLFGSVRLAEVASREMMHPSGAHLEKFFSAELKVKTKGKEKWGCVEENSQPSTRCNTLSHSDGWLSIGSHMVK